MYTSMHPGIRLNTVQFSNLIVDRICISVKVFHLFYPTLTMALPSQQARLSQQTWALLLSHSTKSDHITVMSRGDSLHFPNEFSRRCKFMHVGFMVTALLQD